MHITDGEMGLAMGAGAAIRDLEGKAARAINERNQDLKEAYDEIRKLQVVLLTEQAHSAGLTAEIIALKEELFKADPNNALLQNTGKKYEDGSFESKLHTIYNKAFDAIVAKLPDRFKKKIARRVAK